MLIYIEPTSDVPIYEQVTRQIIEGILQGDIKRGEMLPSVRALAADLGVNMHTVNKSYKILAQKGVVELRPKSGAVVCGVKPFSAVQQEEITANLKPVLAEGMVLGATARQVEELVRKVLADLQQKEAEL